MSEEINKLATQLVTWSELLIEQDRLPFRRVENWAPIATSQGEFKPALTFWINRQSLMAGGVLFIAAEADAEELPQQARCCAEALGLSHFVIWEKSQAAIWKITADELLLEHSFSISAPEQPETFRYTLEDVLQKLKILSVVGAVPAAKLAPSYFCNLFQITLQQTRPAIVDCYRKLRSEQYEARHADILAEEFNRLQLLKLIALLLYDVYPPGVEPDTLEQQLLAALDKLPAELAAILRQPVLEQDPTLPADAAVGFHHLQLRLQQLQWNTARPKALQSLELLLRYWYPAKAETNSAAVTIYPDAPVSNKKTVYVLSPGTVILAATALSAALQGGQLPALRKGELWQLDVEERRAASICANISTDANISLQQRQQWDIALRKAWPNRRFKIRTGQPLWMWEIIFLLGICGEKQTLHITIPTAALKTPATEPIWQFMFQYFSVERLARREENRLELSLLKQSPKGEETHLCIDAQSFKIKQSLPLGHFRAHILLALYLPAQVYQLIADQFSWQVKEQAFFQQKEWQCYQLSSLCRYLEALLGKQSKRAAKETRDVLLPDTKILKSLRQHYQITPPSQIRATIDSTLAEICHCPELTTLPTRVQAQSDSPQTTHEEIPEELRQQVQEQLVRFGIPSFPEQYLYFLDRPKLIQYKFSPPLKVRGSFLGQFSVEDAKHKIIEGYGEELQQALLICAEMNKTRVELPQDRQQLTTMLSRYCKDLNALYKFLLQLCYSQLEDSTTAEQLTRRIWKKNKLPATHWFLQALK